MSAKESICKDAYATSEPQAVARMGIAIRIPPFSGIALVLDSVFLKIASRLVNATVETDETWMVGLKIGVELSASETHTHSVADANFLEDLEDDIVW